MIKRLRYKFMWWIAFAIPKQAALYAFVMVHAAEMDGGPEFGGEYERAYKRWVKQHGIVE